MLRIALSLVVVGLVGLSPQPSVGEELIEEVMWGTSDAEQPAVAKKKIMKQVVERASFRHIVRIIGQAKLNKNRRLIKNKVIEGWGRYIPFLRSGRLRHQNKKYQMEVKMKISIKDLKRLLLDQGLLYEMDGPIKVLPLVQFIDRRDTKTFQWWGQGTLPKRSFLVEQSRIFHAKLERLFGKSGFYVLRPLNQQLMRSIPKPFADEEIGVEDYLFLGEFFRSQLVIRGVVSVKPDKDGLEGVLLEAKLEALHTGNGRIVAQVIRKTLIEDLDATRDFYEGISKSLTVQVLQSWKRGTFGAILFQMAVRGSVNFQQMEVLKEQILSRLKDVKVIRERRLNRTQRIYEIDASKGAQAIGEAIAKTSFEGFQIKVISSKDDLLVLDVRSSSL